jgi:cell division protein FtsZ
MREAGSALMGIGIAHGENRASEAAQKAVSSPLLDSSIDGATGILLNVTGPADMGLFEVNEAAEVVTAAAAADANIIFGAVVDEAMGDDLRVTVIATGFGEQHRRRRKATPTAEPRTQREPVATPAAAPREQKTSESFDIPDEVLDVPSFLRDS